VGGACNAHGRGKKGIQNLVGSCGLDSSGSGWGPLVGYYENGTYKAGNSLTS
jgi:hypothetical protein